MPARACGTIRTAAMAMTSKKSASTIRAMAPAVIAFTSFQSVTSAVAPRISTTCTRAPAS